MAKEEFREPVQESLQMVLDSVNAVSSGGDRYSRGHSSGLALSMLALASELNSKH